MRTQTSGRRATSHTNRTSRTSPGNPIRHTSPTYEPRLDQRGRMRLALLLTSLLAFPLLGWLLERVIEHIPHVEQLSADARREQGDPLREMFTRKRRAQATIPAPKTLSDSVLARIATLSALSSAAEAASSTPVPGAIWGGSPEVALARTPDAAIAWPVSREGALTRPAGVVLGVLWFWALIALWTSCLVGVTNPALALRVLELVVTLATRALAFVRGVGGLLAWVGANVPMTAGLSLLVLGLGLVAWMLVARQFNRLVLGA